MQLLHASSVPVPQFASLSLLLTEGIAEPITVVGANAACSAPVAMTAIQELHRHIRSIIGRNDADDLASQLLREEDQSLNSTQVFRPISGNGMGMQYRFVRTSNDTDKLHNLILAVNKSAPVKIDAATELLGIVLCVAMAGLGPVQCALSLPYAIPQRINDCLGYLLRLGDLAAVKSLLRAYLLTDDDSKISNEQAEAPHVLLLPESDERVLRGLLSPLGMISPIAEFGRTARRASTGIVRGVMSAGAGIGAFHTTTAETASTAAAAPLDLGFPLRLDVGAAEGARALSEKLTVLSVSETGTILRPYSTSGRDRAANLDLTGGAKSRFRRRKADGRAADFDHFDYKGPTKAVIQRENKAVSSQASIPESTAGKLQIKSSSKDTKRGGPSTRRMSTQMGGREDDSSHQPLQKNSLDPINRRRRPKAQFDDETNDSRSNSGNQDTSSVLSQERIQVSIALNEDLTCSYKLSQLSSCSVEGVVQVSL
jgi:hypothetical protein